MKFDGGRCLQGVGFGGLYTSYTDARRSVNDLRRRWDDTNGNRLVECDHNNPAAHSSFGDYCGSLKDFFGNPDSDSSGSDGRPTPSRSPIRIRAVV